MAESLEGYIAKLKAEYERSGKGSLEFMLQQIRELAAKATEPQKTEPKPAASAQALEQFRQEKKDLSPDEARTELEKNMVLETVSQINNMHIGKMIFFRYEAKTKAKLPYWDMFPLVIPFRVHAGYMLGMNMHYLPPVERARLMMALWTTANTTKLDPQTKLLINYKMLNESSKYIWFKPCIKKYLFPYLRSRIMIVNSQNWNKVLMMPLAGFQKAPEFKVWNDSIQKVRESMFQI